MWEGVINLRDCCGQPINGDVRIVVAVLWHITWLLSGKEAQVSDFGVATADLSHFGELKQHSVWLNCPHTVMIDQLASDTIARSKALHIVASEQRDLHA